MDKAKKNVVYTRIRVWSIGILCTFIVFVAVRLIAEQTTKNGNSQKSEDAHKLKCYVCHFCPKPTSKNPCLYPCPRHLSKPEKDLKTSPENGPEIIIINKLEHYYNPTHFNHKIHARMAAMSRGCVECHHYSPEGIYPPCKACHKPGISDHNIQQVGLKGAYHRQCLRCHHEWGGDTDCEVCHTSKSKTVSKNNLKKHHFPVAQPPGNVEFDTHLFQRSKVTFDHAGHAEDYDLRCQNCHQGSGCLPCHDQKHKKRAPDEHPVTVPCLDCHAEMDCMDCHISPPQTKAFDHNKTKFPMRSFHQKVGCRQCHTNQARHHTMPLNCQACHEQNWIEQHFKHDSAGFVMDESHQELECHECHTQNKYTKKPACVECHEDEISFPESVPGTKIKEKTEAQTK